MSQVHLLKVEVRTVWVVVDDDGIATEQVGAPAVVSAADWPGFYKVWEKDFEAVKAMVAEKTKPPPNRAARRAKKAVPA